MTVTKSVVESMIGIHGHHVFAKPHFFFTYLLPVLEAIAGGFFVMPILRIPLVQEIQFLW